MPRQTCLALSALLILAAPQIATPQASEPCCQVTSPATAMPTQPVSTIGGSDKVPITILVFSDFESFPCARSASVIDGFLQQTRDVRVIFKHAPAASNPNAFLAHEAALAAGAQGRFWGMHDTLFENQTHLTRADLLGYAKSLGLDLSAFERALDNHTYRPIVAAGPAQQIDLAHAPTRGPATAPISLVEGKPRDRRYVN
jgi:protein-disulfide isomerase